MVNVQFSMKTQDCHKYEIFFFHQRFKRSFVLALKKDEKRRQMYAVLTVARQVFNCKGPENCQT